MKIKTEKGERGTFRFYDFRPGDVFMHAERLWMRVGGKNGAASIGSGELIDLANDALCFPVAGEFVVRGHDE
jgi:hypothetical protein